MQPRLEANLLVDGADRRGVVDILCIIHFVFGIQSKDTVFQSVVERLVLDLNVVNTELKRDEFEPLIKIVSGAVLHVVGVLIKRSLALRLVPSLHLPHSVLGVELQEFIFVRCVELSHLVLGNSLHSIEHVVVGSIWLLPFVFLDDGNGLAFNELVERRPVTYFSESSAVQRHDVFEAILRRILNFVDDESLLTSSNDSLLHQGEHRQAVRQSSHRCGAACINIEKDI